MATSSAISGFSEKKPDSISYNSISAYTEREANRLADADRAAQKQIADAALAEVANAQTQINQNYDNAVQAAYRQNDRTAKNLKAETSQIGNQALTERLVRGLDMNKARVGDTMDNINLGIKANQQQNEADIGKNYDLPQAQFDAELRLAQQEQDAAQEKAQADKQASEGYLEQLNNISKEAGYNYDFDADIFALEQMGYDSDVWQIQYLEEAKRLQNRNASALKSSKSSSGSGGSSNSGGYYSPYGDYSSGGTGSSDNGVSLDDYKYNVLTRNVTPQSVGVTNRDATASQRTNANALVKMIPNFNSDSEAVEYIQKTYENGLITAGQVQSLLRLMGY